jgi:hypothetical protein
LAGNVTIKTRTCLKNPLGLAKLANVVSISPIQKDELTMEPIGRQPTDTGNIDMVEDIINSPGRSSAIFDF